MNRIWLPLKYSQFVKIAAAVGAAIAFFAVVATNLEMLSDAYKRLFGRVPAEINIRDARGLFAEVLGSGLNPGRGFMVAQVEIEVIVSKKGEGEARNCKGELVFSGGGIALASRSVLQSGDSTFSILEHVPVQKKYILEFKIPAYRYNPDVGRIRVVCDDLISESVAVPSTNMLRPTKADSYKHAR